MLVRHAPAQTRVSARGDAKRALTLAGRARMRKAALGLIRLVPQVDVIASSPLVRARETAAVLSAAYGLRRARVLNELTPGTEPAALLKAVRTHKRSTVIVLVGHEPDLSRFAAWLMTGAATDLFALKKGGACLLTLTRRRAGHARLRWLLEAKQLTKLRPR